MTTTTFIKEQTALEKYEETQDAIRRLLKQIESGLTDHDRRASGKIGGHTWGHVGDLNAIEAQLREIKDRLCLTGEYAKL